MRLHHRLRDIGRFELIAGAVLDVDDVHVGVLALHLIDEAVAPIDARPTRLVVDDDSDFALVADHLGHLVGRRTRRGDVVGGGRRHGNAAVHA